MKQIYTFGIYCYYFVVWIASFFNKKANLWIKGRKDLLRKIKQRMGGEEAGIAWFHAASLGEFEQGRSLIESFRKEFPECKVLLTFFSPSGYEIRKKYEHADYVFYLPLDTTANARKFLDIVNPQYAFFIKYEFWFNFLDELRERNIQTYLVSGIFRHSQHFFKSYGNWFRRRLQAFSYFFVQNKKSEKLLNSIGFDNVYAAGDTRFDRVFTIASQVKQIPIIEEFKADKKLLIAGSTWQPDELLLQEFVLKTGTEYKLVLAPHEISANRLQELKRMFPTAVFHSKATIQNIKEANIIVIDSIGLLSSLYQYGDIALVGGGFGKGIHNILEAATFGLPVCFGPTYQKFQEAVDLVKVKGAFSVANKEEFCNIAIELLQNEEKRQAIGAQSKSYVQQKIGATQFIINYIKRETTVS